MYRIPGGLDLSPMVGEFTTQIRVGPFDLQFSFGPVSVTAMSTVTVHRGDDVVATWSEGTWPEPGFYDLMNTPVVAASVHDERRIVVELENGLTVTLVDDSDEHECLHIRVGDDLWVV